MVHSCGNKRRSVGALTGLLSGTQDLIHCGISPCPTLPPAPYSFSYAAGRVRVFFSCFSCCKAKGKGIISEISALLSPKVEALELIFFVSTAQYSGVCPQVVPTSVIPTCNGQIHSSCRCLGYFHDFPFNWWIKAGIRRMPFLSP